jgi:anthranilate phosphoribosyltransferase
MKSALEQLTAGADMTRRDAAELMMGIIGNAYDDMQIAGLLTALKTKGETSLEIAGFADALLVCANKIVLADDEAVDCCGTGGDGSGSFNISTASAIVAAGAGAKIAKHGNRSVSSQCGSADLLEYCGVKIDPGIDAVRDCYEKLGICFMYAPRFHPGIKAVMPARKALGVRTIFNMLGPLLNPARVTRQLLGVYSKDVMPLFADTLLELGSKRALVVHSHDGLDEISASAPTDVIELCDGRLKSYSVTPESLGVSKVDIAEIAGGDAKANQALLRSLLNGRQTGARPATLANAGAVIYLAGLSESIEEGVHLARSAVDSGAAREILSEWLNL